MNSMVYAFLFGAASDDAASNASKKDYVEKLEIDTSSKTYRQAMELGHRGSTEDSLNLFMTADAKQLLTSHVRNKYWLYRLIAATVAVRDSSRARISANDVARAMNSLSEPVRQAMAVHKPIKQLTVEEACERVAAGVLLVTSVPGGTTELVFNPIFQFRSST